MPKWRGGASSNHSGSCSGTNVVRGATKSTTLTHPPGQQQYQHQHQQHQRPRGPANPSGLSTTTSGGGRIAGALLPAYRRRYLGAALFLCATGVILGAGLDRAATGDLRLHPPTPSTPPSSSEGSGGNADRTAPPPVDSERRVASQSDGGGPGGPWNPPAERPIPLDKFPRLNGVGFKADGALLDVHERPPLAAAMEASPWGDSGNPALNLSASSNSGNGRGGIGGGSGGEGRDGNLAEAAAEEAGAAISPREEEPTTTLLFMHLWKCAGSSLRHLLRDWAEAKRQEIGIVVRCADPVNEEGKICMQRHALIDEEVQRPFIRRKQVVAGHFTWGFQQRVQQPFVMFTTLRNPLELFVSGQQYLNRKASRHFAHAVSLVQETMVQAIRNHYMRGGVMMPEGMGNAKSVGFIYRLVDPVRAGSPGEGANGSKPLQTAAQEARDNLDTFWLVGVIEQYQGFMAVLQAMMDPLQSERPLWESYSVGRYNKSPQGAGKVLAAIDPGLVREFNHTLHHQWEVYAHAVDLYKHRCFQMLHNGDRLDLCEVPVAPSEYTLTDLEREYLYQDLHPETASLNASEILRAQQLWVEHGAEVEGLDAEEAFLLLERHGFDLTEPEKKENLGFRLGIAGLPLAEQAGGGDGGGGDGGFGEDADVRAAMAGVEEEAGESAEIPVAT
ncbi:unnamed protein product [Scytosiphon promiscuus]